jgi:hypothetical protein
MTKEEQTKQFGKDLIWMDIERQLTKKPESYIKERIKQKLTTVPKTQKIYISLGKKLLTLPTGKIDFIISNIIKEYTKISDNNLLI